jgi:hypothetical protein
LYFDIAPTKESQLLTKEIGITQLKSQNWLDCINHPLQCDPQHQQDKSPQISSGWTGGSTTTTSKPTFGKTFEHGNGFLMHKDIHFIVVLGTTRGISN